MLAVSKKMLPIKLGILAVEMRMLAVQRPKPKWQLIMQEIFHSDAT